MKWIVQSNIFNEPFYEKMIGFFDKVGITYEIVKAVPFSGEMLPEPVVEGHAIAIGSYSFTNRAKELWTPGSWTNEMYDYRWWSKMWKGMILNEPGHTYQFANVPEQEGLFFIRPCADDKLFTGAVMDWPEFSEWRRKALALELDASYANLHADSWVVVAEPRKIDSEYRFVIVDTAIITGSMYKSGNIGLYKEVTPDQVELLAFVRKVVDAWTPARVFCLDIALADGEYKVLEMGNFNSAGLYLCDVQKIVIAIEDMVNH